MICGEGSECKADGGDGSTIDCTGSPKCELKGGNSAATCRDSDCKLNMGAASEISCFSSTCDVKCGDNCAITDCDADATCTLSCVDSPDQEEGEPGTVCEGGRVTCGDC